MNMGNQMQNQTNNNSGQNNELSAEDKLLKIKNLFDKGLIDESEYKDKKDEILANI